MSISNQVIESNQEFKATPQSVEVPIEIENGKLYTRDVYPGGKFWLTSKADYDIKVIFDGDSPLEGKDSTFTLSAKVDTPFCFKVKNEANGTYEFKIEGVGGEVRGLRLVVGSENPTDMTGFTIRGGDRGGWTAKTTVSQTSHRSASLPYYILKILPTGKCTDLKKNNLSLTVDLFANGKCTHGDIPLDLNQPWTRQMEHHGHVATVKVCRKYNGVGQPGGTEHVEIYIDP